MVNEGQTQQFSHLRPKRGYHYLAEGYPRFSIILHSPSNEFALVQRCTFCLSLHFLWTLLDVLYHDKMEQVNTKKNTNSLSILCNFIDITSEQVCENHLSCIDQKQQIIKLIVSDEYQRYGPIDVVLSTHANVTKYK